MHRTFRKVILPLLGVLAQSVLDDFARQFTAFQSP